MKVLTPTHLDAAHLVGVPYSKKNCWQLCEQYYLDVLGVKLEYNPEFDTTDKHLSCSFIKANKQDFMKVASPNKHDLIVIRIQGVECHIGIYLNSGLFLHTTKKTGSVIDRVGRWQNMIEGYYRYDSL